MALPELHPVSEAVVFAHSAQIGATPAAAYARVPFRGKVLKVGVVQSAAVTGTGTVATAVNGNAISGGSLSVTGGAAGTLFTAVPTAANDVTRTMSSRSRHQAPPAPRPAPSSP
jgi:hypothetical protein